MKTIFILFLSSFSLIGWSQDFSYEYDQKGNRITRKVIPLKTSSGSQNLNDLLIEQEKQEVMAFAIDKELIAYPNPTISSVDIQGWKESDVIKNVLVFDAKGRQIQDFTPLENQVKIDLSQFPPGNYYVKVNLTDRVENFTISKQ